MEQPDEDAGAQGENKQNWNPYKVAEVHMYSWWKPQWLVYQICVKTAPLKSNPLLIILEDKDNKILDILQSWVVWIHEEL